MSRSQDRSQQSAHHIDGHREQHDPLGREVFGDMSQWNLRDQIAPEITAQQCALQGFAPAKGSVLLGMNRITCLPKFTFILLAAQLVTYLNLGRYIGGATWRRADLNLLAGAAREIRNGVMIRRLLLHQMYGRVVHHGHHGHTQIHLQPIDNGHANGAHYGEHIACGHQLCKMQIELTVDQLLGWVRAIEVEMAMTRAIEMGMLPRAHRKKKKTNR